MTRKLYDLDSHRRDFSATVLRCDPDGARYAVVLDQTVFFPEGGGQPADTGVLGGARVLDVQLLPDAIVHYTDAPLAPSAQVRGQIDWPQRFRRMQSHSGEHIISGLIHKEYGFDNVGFHLGEDAITMDYSGELTWTQLMHIEQLANEAVYRNVPIRAEYPAPEQLAHMEYRSKLDLKEDIRIVTVEGYDVCACCAPHVSHTGEIGAVKILTVENFHEGIRLTMICGKRVMDYLNMVNDQNRQVSMKLSAKIGETAAAVARLQDENFRLKGQVNHMFDELCTVEAKNWEGAGSVLLFHEGLEADQVRRMADAVMQKCSGCCAVFSANGDGSYKYAIGEQNGDLRQFTKEMNAALNGRGGGKPFFVQGSVKASEDEIRQFFRQ